MASRVGTSIEKVDDASEAGTMLALLAPDGLRSASSPDGSLGVLQLAVRRKRGGKCVRAKQQNKHLLLSASAGGKTYESQYVQSCETNTAPASPCTHTFFLLDVAAFGCCGRD